MIRALVGMVVASLVAGCAGSSPTPDVVFFTSDRTTSAQVAAIRLISADGVVPSEVIDAVASNIRVATWPDDVEVPTIQTILTGVAAALPNTVVPGGIVMIDRQLDPGLDPSAWYAISLPPSTAYTLPAGAFAFADGARGARFSPAHAPVVASFMSCPHEGGVVAVDAWYSERVVHAAGAIPALDYGTPSVSCTIGVNEIALTQFHCPSTEGGEPFSLRIPDGVMAQDSKAPMVPGSLDSAGMQTTPASAGCTIYMPVTAD